MEEERREERKFFKVMFAKDLSSQNNKTICIIVDFVDVTDDDHTVCLGIPCPSGPPFPRAVKAALLAFMASLFFCSAIFCKAKNLFFLICIRLAI